ncbi:hypothetical protein [Sporosarcina sp. G11-34]
MVTLARDKDAVQDALLTAKMVD